jgi:hypothetical protein
MKAILCLLALLAINILPGSCIASSEITNPYEEISVEGETIINFLFNRLIADTDLAIKVLDNSILTQTLLVDILPVALNKTFEKIYLPKNGALRRIQDRIQARIVSRTVQINTVVSQKIDEFNEFVQSRAAKQRDSLAKRARATNPQDPNQVKLFEKSVANFFQNSDELLFDVSSLAQTSIERTQLLYFDLLDELKRDLEDVKLNKEERQRVNRELAKFETEVNVLTNNLVYVTQDHIVNTFRTIQTKFVTIRKIIDLRVSGLFKSARAYASEVVPAAEETA